MFRKQDLVSIDRSGIAERLRGLVKDRNDGDLGVTAASLGLEEVALRMSIDELSPHPTVEVLAAVIEAYGVDPTWLLTGTYDASTHRSAIETDDLPKAIRALMGVRTARIAEPPYERIHLHDQN